MSSSIVLKALGLNFQPNQLSVPEGSLSEASNIIIRRDNVVESRRGMKLYGTELPDSAVRINQLMQYKGRILRNYSDVLQFDSDGNGTFESFSGTYSETQPGLRIKSIEANGNFYFTTSDGIKKISASDANQFTTAPGYITNAGGVKAISFTAQVIDPPSSTTGFLPQDSAVAYRTVWGLKDVNNNTILGAPSQAVAVYNPLLNLLIPNYMDLLEALDAIKPTTNSGFFNYGQYVNTFKVPINAGADEVGTSAVLLASQIDQDMVFANDSGTLAALTLVSAAATSATTVRITVTGTATNYLALGNKISLTGFGAGSTSGKSINATQIISAIGSTTFDFVLIGGGLTTSETFSTTGATVVNDKYRSITVPITPSIPPTDADLVSIQNYIQTIITDLQGENSNIIPTPAQVAYITPLTITNTADVQLDIDIPQDVTINNFLQIYRGTTVTATGTDVLNDLVPNDEMQLVYEAYPTQAELTARKMIVDDITPDIFKGANLYTNASTGEGILQANDVPPFAKDINVFKNITFYANTKTRHRIVPFSLLGVSNMIEDYNNGIIPSITIADTSGIENTYTFTLGVAQVTTIQCIAKASITASAYFDINSASNATLYRFWYDTTGSDPEPAAGGRTLIKIQISTLTSATDVASATRDVMAGEVADFETDSSTDTVTVTNVNSGYTDAPSVGTSGFTIIVTTSGSGESVTNKEILLSNAVSPAQAVSETSLSMVNVINGNPDEIIYAYYNSTPGLIPGKMTLEARSLSDVPFYLLANDTNTGSSFSPDISPATEISGSGVITVGNPTTLTSTSHGLSNNDKIIISGSDSTPTINGIRTVTVTGVNTFTIPVHVTSVPGGNQQFSYTKLTAAPVSQNEVKPNRIYYSKQQQPEAVPIVNFLDAGATNKAILRIFPLRDSLFIFKEDGLFRISGETTDSLFLSLFDSSCIVVAPDSVDIANNVIYAFTRQGISNVTEAGATTISRPIDTVVQVISSDNYPGFSTATWGLGYESDNSFLMATVSKPEDVIASIIYRYSNLTNTWTTFDLSTTCGIINSNDDKLYMGAGDVAFIEQERKTFTRLDYADREVESQINSNTVTGLSIHLPSVTNFQVGDVIVQEQYLTNYKYNSLLQKLDIDLTVGVVNITAISQSGTQLTITANNHNLSTSGSYVTIQNNTSIPSINGVYPATYVNGNVFQITTPLPIVSLAINGQARLNYYETLKAVTGNDLRIKLVQLAAKLDTDPGLTNTNYSSIIASKSGTITFIDVGEPAKVTSNGNGLVAGRLVSISGSNSVPSINGERTVSIVNSNIFSVPVSVNTAGSTGTFATDNNDFTDIQACFNAIINNLNSDSGATFSNYLLSIGITTQEAIIDLINVNTKVVTLNISPDWVVGPITVFKGIATTVTYTPATLGDALGIKHMSEATVMFENKAFTDAILSFASDLLPELIAIPFLGSGNGIFGSQPFGENFFGGGSHAAPFRTWIPRDCQRCRFLIVQFDHRTAREKYSIYGISLTGLVGQSTRAYR